MSGAACSQVTFEQRISAAQNDVLRIKQRYFVLDALVAELERVTRGKTFRICNDVMWTTLLDSRDMLVVHLASWARATYGAGGLFGRLQALHVRDLRRKETKKAGGDAHLAQMDREALDATYSRLFPGVDPSRIGPSDLAALRNRFASEVAHVVADRDNHRAHAWEKNNRADVRFLKLDEVGATFDMIDLLLNDLRLVGTNSTMSSHSLTYVSPGLVADDLVDLILIGTAYGVERLRAGRARSEMYEAMHAAHDGSNGSRLFNELVEPSESEG